jgi:uncharacterized protein YraI
VANLLRNRPLLIGVVVIFAVVAYLIFTAVFYLVFQYTSAAPPPSTATVAPTFTVTPVAAEVVVANVTMTATPLPAATLLPTMSPTTAQATDTPPVPPTNTSAPPTALPASATPTANTPQLVAATVVNVRGGPGTAYQILGQLPVNQPVPVVGRNSESSWWVIPLPDGRQGWVAASVVTASGPLSTLPVVQSPSPPASPTPVPPTAPPPAAFQYEPTGWYADTNYGLTRFLGTITDGNGNPVNGVSVEAQCGDFRVISNPSGPVGWPPFYDSANDPPGFYDITLDTRPIVCNWLLTVVDSPDGKNVSARMSDAIEVETTTESSIITANWRKNW